MARLGHHLYTSFGGYRTVFASDWLGGLIPSLERRAQDAVAGEPGIDVLRNGGWNLVTVIRDNGSDHVGRPRRLAHTLVLAENERPPMCSPLGLQVHALDHLDADDPGLAHDLEHQLDPRRLTRTLPHPDEFGRLLGGPGGQVLSAAFAALVEPEARPLALDLDERLPALAEFAHVASIWFLHEGPRHFSTLGRPLTAPGRPPSLFLPPAEHLRYLVLQHQAVATRPEALPAAPGDFVTRLASVARLPRALAILRHVDPRQLAAGCEVGRVLAAVDADMLAIDRRGAAHLDPRAPEAPAILADLHRLGAGALVRRLLDELTEPAGRDDAETCDEIDARILAARTIDDFAFILHRYAATRTPHTP